MCEQRVYLMNEGEEKLIMEAVDRMQVVAGGVRVMNLFGEEKTVDAKFHSWANNKMVLKVFETTKHAKHAKGAG